MEHKSKNNHKNDNSSVKEHSIDLLSRLYEHGNYKSKYKLRKINKSKNLNESSKEQPKLIFSEEKGNYLLRKLPDDTRTKEVKVPSALHSLIGKRKNAVEPILDAKPGQKNVLKFSSHTQLPLSKESLNIMQNELTSVKLNKLKKQLKNIENNKLINDNKKNNIKIVDNNKKENNDLDLYKKSKEYLKSPFSFIDKLSTTKNDTDEFIYLKAIGPYKLEIIPHHQINPSNYYTMSKKGITHFYENNIDFTPLEQWKREYYLYTKMMNISFFNTFQQWKGFFVGKIY